MKALLAIGCITIFALCGCSQTPSQQDDEHHYGTIQTYVDGTLKATYWVTVHSEPKPGQYWETTTEAFNYVHTERWQIVEVNGSTALIEHRSLADGEHLWFEYVMAYEVNLDAGEGEANVTMAWIGKPGDRPTAIQVMVRPEQEPTEDGATDYELRNEDFSGFEIAGHVWTGTMTTVVGDGWESRYWTATDGWFGGLIKTEGGGIVTELKAFGHDAKPLLDW